jgi:hypothetical protein
MVSDAGYLQTVDTFLQGLKRGGEAGNFGLELGNSLSGGGVGGGGFGALAVQE